jgi:hypothetical protein
MKKKEEKGEEEVGSAGSIVQGSSGRASVRPLVQIPVPQKMLMKINGRVLHSKFCCESKLVQPL